MKENMTQRIKAFIVLLAATVATAGTAWGQSNETLGYINYTQGSDDGGTLTFYRMSTAYVDDEIAITNGKSAAIPIAAPSPRRTVGTISAIESTSNSHPTADTLFVRIKIVLMKKKSSSP